MSYSKWDVNKVSAINSAKGQAVGYVAGLYSTPGMTNVAAASAEVLNQYGYSIYQDDDGHFKVIQDRDTKGGSVWTSDSLGVTMDYSGDSFTMTSTSDSSSSSSSSSSYTSDLNSLLSTPSSESYQSFSQSVSDSFASNCNNTLNKLNASLNSGTSYSSASVLKSNETLDPLTGIVIDKEKSQEIDELALSKSQQLKFDNVAKLINDVKEAQDKATVTTDTAGTMVGGAAAGALAGAAGTAAVGAIIGSSVPVVGTVIGGAIGLAVGLIGGACVAASNSESAKQANQQSANDAAQAGAELTEALNNMTDEELIAFQRYYYQKTGVEVSDVLHCLEVDENSSTIAQQSGINNEWIAGAFERIDNANKILKPESSSSVSESTTKEYTLTEQANLQILAQEMQQTYQNYLNAFNGNEVVIDGEIKTVDELKQIYLDKVQEYEDYQNKLNQ